MRRDIYSVSSAYAREARGFVALVSALIFSIVLMLLVLSEGTAAFWTRSDQTEQEQSAASRALAESCMYEALLDYSEDPASLTARVDVPIDPGDTCTIEPVQSAGRIITFMTRAKKGTIPSFLVVTATDDSGNLSVTSWRTATSIPP